MSTYSDIEIAIVKGIQKNATLIPLLGVWAKTTANGVSVLDSTTVTVATTNGFEAAGAFYLSSDSVAVTYTGKTTTTFTGCGAHRATVNAETVKQAACHRRIRSDINQYYQPQTPAVAITLLGREQDDRNTIRSFDKTFTGYLEVIGIGGNMGDTEDDVKSVMDTIESLFETEAMNSSPFSETDIFDVFLGSSTMIQGEAAARLMAVVMFCNFTVENIVNV